LLHDSHFELISSGPSEDCHLSPDNSTIPIVTERTTRGSINADSLPQSSPFMDEDEFRNSNANTFSEQVSASWSRHPSREPLAVVAEEQVVDEGDPIEATEEESTAMPQCKPKRWSISTTWQKAQADTRQASDTVEGAATPSTLKKSEVWTKIKKRYSSDSKALLSMVRKEKEESEIAQESCNVREQRASSLQQLEGQHQVPVAPPSTLRRLLSLGGGEQPGFEELKKMALLGSPSVHHEKLCEALIKAEKLKVRSMILISVLVHPLLTFHPSPERV
jgi:hypothetical protein